MLIYQVSNCKNSTLIYYSLPLELTSRMIQLTFFAYSLNFLLILLRNLSYSLLHFPSWIL